MAGNNFQIKEVRNKRDFQKFLDVARAIYKDDPVWVCPLDEEIKAIFNPKTNPYLKNGEAKLWYAYHPKEGLVGRIAAFYNREKVQRYEVPTGGIGFFESIENPTLAHRLFDIALAWLKEKGMKKVEGPVNLGENDTYWGLLVKGFTHPGYGMPYNKPYYESLFLSYGFKVQYEQITRHLDITKPMPERFQKIWRWVQSRPNIRFDYAKKHQMEKYIRDFITVYNQAWRHHKHFVPLTYEKVAPRAAVLKHIIIEKFMIFAYVNDEPAGILFCLPDLNQIFKPLKGKFPWWQKLLFAWRKRNDYEWYRKKGILTRGRVLIIGVVPKYQRYGLEVGMTMCNMDDARAMGFKEIELGWVGDFNPLSARLQAATQATLGKIHRTYWKEIE